MRLEGSELLPCKVFPILQKTGFEDLKLSPRLWLAFLSFFFLLFLFLKRERKGTKETANEHHRTRSVFGSWGAAVIDFLCLHACR